MSFNTLHTELNCPFCGEKVESGVGFRFGLVANLQYRLGDRIRWDGAPTRPSTRPKARTVKTIGYFNCDNIRCKSWQDCFPQVQPALVTIEDDVLAVVEPFSGTASYDGFDIIEPKDLS